MAEVQDGSAGVGTYVGEEPVRLAAHKEAIKDRLEELRGELPRRLQPTDPLREQYSLVDSASSITILGERGSGKTTLLYSVCRDLIDREQDLVLPPMQPELFSPSESVISAFLAGLWTLYIGTEEHGDPKEIDSQLARLLTNCARSFAASRTTEEALAHASDSTIDFAEDAVAISRSGARLPHQLRTLARRLCVDPDKGPRLMVVPVDDPDMSPLAVRAILRDVRILGSIPGVVPIAAFCEEDLSTEWMNEREIKTTSELTDATRRFERQAEKLFPYRSRFEIQPFAAASRINFSPIGETEPLREKLSALRRALETDEHVWPIDEVLGEVRTRYGIPNPLPGNARTLVQVWRSLDQVDSVGDGNSRELLIRVASNLLTLLSAPLRTSLGLPVNSRFYEIQSAGEGDESGKFDVHVEHDTVALYATPETTLYGSDGNTGAGSIQLRKIGRIAAVKATDSGTETRLPAYSPAATSALLAFNEVAFSSGLFNVRNDLARIGQSDWIRAQEVSLAGLATDDWFLTLSDAFTLSETIQAADDWNRLAALADDGASPRELLTAALCASFVATGAVSSLDENSTYEEIFEQATTYYSSHRERSDRISKRFCAWYEFELPMQWHSAFFGASTLRRCCSEYRRVAEQAIRRDTGDHWRSPRTYVDTRFAKILDVITDDADKGEHCWLAGYFELASAIESTKLDKLLELSPFWRERTAAQHAGSRLAGKAFSRVKGKHRLAPYSTPEGSELFIRARSMLRKRHTAALRSVSRTGKR